MILLELLKAPCNRYGVTVTFTCMLCMTVAPLTFEVIVTVMELVPGGVTCGGGVFEPLPPPLPPQATSIDSSIRHAPRKHRFLFRFRRAGTNTKPTKAPKLKAANATYLAGPRCIGLASAAAVPAVVTVICTEVLPFAAGVALAGLKVQVACSGTPEQVNVIVLLNPPSEVTVRLNVADWPARIVALNADELALKFSTETKTAFDVAGAE